LQVALARDGNDLQALTRLNELAKAGENLDARRADRRATTLERFLLTTDPSRSNAVAGLLRARVLDPMAAAWREAQLVACYLQDGAPGPIADWMAAQLDPGGLAEAASWLKAPQAWVRRASITTPFYLARRDLDVRVLETEADAVMRELARRPGLAAPPSTRQGLSPLLATTPVPTDLASLPSDERQRFWEALLRMGARTELAPGVAVVRDDLAMFGYRDNVTTLEQDHALLARRRASSVFLLRDRGAGAESAIGDAAVRVRSGLAPLHVSHPDQVAALQTRLEALRQAINSVPLLGRFSLRHPTDPLSPMDPFSRSWPTAPIARPSQARWDAWGAALSGRPTGVATEDEPPSVASSPPRPYGDPVLTQARDRYTQGVAKLEPKASLGHDPWGKPLPARPDRDGFGLPHPTYEPHPEPRPEPRPEPHPEPHPHFL
jgi:hypothetical protein